MKYLAGLLLLTSSTFSIAQTAWDTARANSITRAVEAQLTKSLLVYKDGQIVFKYGDTHKNYQVFSIRKSLVSLLYGIYLQEAKIDLDQTLAQLGIDDKQGLTTVEKEAKLVDLLRARSGVYHPAAYETPGMVNNRPQRGQYKPGEHWFYNNWDFNTLTTIFEKKTGQKVFNAFNERIAERIEMEDFNVNDQQYYFDSMSVHPATLWFMSASDLSKLGLLLLNKGSWKGKQVIDSSWITGSTAAYSDLGILGGYGMCWWSAFNGNHYPFVTLPDGTYSARGTGEQTLLVIPQRKMVIVHLTEVKSPGDAMMKVTAFGRLLKLILN